MAFSISPIHLPSMIPLPANISGPKDVTGAFQSALSEAIGRVQQFHENSQDKIGKFLSGEDEEVHKVALATQQAELSLDLFMQVRNKVVAAYQEVMRMQM
jgi:flagellar hook-basal body complex protein FliE